MSWKPSLRTSLLPCWVIVCILISPIHGQVFSLATCPTLTGATISVLGVTTGTWYEYERTPTIREHYIRCISYTFSQDTTNSRYNIAIGGTNKLTGNTISTRGFATYTTATVGTWYVRFPSLRLSRFPLTYYVIATDATAAIQGTYLVLFSCTNFKLGTIRSVIVLTSLRFPSQTTIDLVNAAVSPYVSLGYLTQNDQTNC